VADLVMPIMEILIYILAWCLFVAVQCQNSVRSNTNGLQGWAGVQQWVKGQTVNLLVRALFSAVFFPTFTQWVTGKLHSVGLNLAALAIAAITGYAANGLLYQIFGFIPWLRVEIADLNPPSDSIRAAISTVTDAAIARVNAGVNVGQGAEGVPPR
jgi:hypothetical protein